jgi:hypothetical protein
MLEILAAGLLTIPYRVAQLVFLALGLPKLYSSLIAIRVIALFILTPLGFHFLALPGALLGIVGAYFSSVPIAVYYNIKFDLFDTRKELLMLLALPIGMLTAETFNLAVNYWKH